MITNSRSCRYSNASVVTRTNTIGCLSKPIDVDILTFTQQINGVMS
jgi:hypothetical protein